MTEYVFRRQVVFPGEEIEIPDNAKDVDFQHREESAVVSWFEKKGECVI